jgi:hypothetical protein
MGEVGLVLHPEKTKIVYCGMDRAEHWTGPRSFTFLGFEFRRRGNRTSWMPSKERDRIWNGSSRIKKPRTQSPRYLKEKALPE